MLESLSQTNIGSLNIEEPKLEAAYFDPETDLRPDDWGKIDEWINSFYPNNPEKLDHTWFINLMSPNRVNNLDRPDLDRIDMDSDWVYGIYSEATGHITTQLEWAANGENELDARKGWIQEAMNYLAPLTTLFPEKNLELQAFFTKEMIDIALEDVVDPENRFEVGDYLNYAIFLPEQVLPIIRSNQQIKEFLLSSVSEWSDDYKFRYRHEYEGETFPIYAASVRLLLPDEKLAVESYQKNYNLMKQGLTWYGQVENWATFVQVAWSMQVLSAERAELLEDGTIKITPNLSESFTKSTPDLPEVRKF